MKKIAIDGMGGDYAPEVVVQGVIEALREFEDVDLKLTGHKNKLAFYLEKFNMPSHPRLEIIHAEQVVEMSETSSTALRKKKNSSITVAAELLRDRYVEGIVSAGHTGATVAATTVKVRTLDGIHRPAIAAIMPATEGRWILIDAGANPECKADDLLKFAIMGETFSKIAFNVTKPKVGLLSVGDEDIKGNALTKETFKLLQSAPVNFIGNVEGHDVFKKVADVVVCDGFVGNVLLKSCESLAHATLYWLKDVFTKNAFRKTGAMLAKNAFRDLKAIADFEEYGGAPLLGINGHCIIGHGASSAKAIKNAIKMARRFIDVDINTSILNKVAKL